MVDRYNKLGDRMYTKIFVGGLAWKTRSRSLSHYFEQFGEILEAVVIYDKYTGKSKGFGFVTFKKEESARRACEIPHPVIDGRKANCNLAFLGATKHHPPATYLVQVAKMKPGPHNKGYPFSPGYSAHSQEYYYPMSYFNVQTGGHQYPIRQDPVYLNYYYPVHDEQQGSSSGSQYPKFVPVTVLPEQWIPRPVVPMLAPPPTIELPPMAAAEASKSGSRVVIAPNALPTNSIVTHTRPQLEEEEKEDPNLRILTVTEDRSNDLLTD